MNQRWTRETNPRQEKGTQRKAALHADTTGAIVHGGARCIQPPKKLGGSLALQRAPTEIESGTDRHIEESG